MLLSDKLGKFFRSRVRGPKVSDNAAQPAYPLGLSRDQAAALQHLIEQPQWKHYLGAVERVYEQQLSALLRGMEHDAYLFQCGVCYALERVAKLPHEITDKVREFDARRQKPDATDPGAAIFPNTPYYDAWKRRVSVSE